MNSYKPLILFLLRFFGSYILMIVLYDWYLNFYFDQGMADPFTKFNADASAWLFNLMGIRAESLHAGNDKFMRLALDGKFTSIVNEGCNAISVMIIFIAFILAFYTKFKETLLYILISLVLLIFMNILRITLLTYIYKFLKEYSKIGHDYLFPAIIYGTVLILWFVWIKGFVIKKKKYAEQVG